jgi:hypothetical protein
LIELSLTGAPDGNFDLILILERPDDDDCSRTSTSTKTVAAWKGDILKRSRLAKPLKFWDGKADIVIRHNPTASCP